MIIIFLQIFFTDSLHGWAIGKAKAFNWKGKEWLNLNNLKVGSYNHIFFIDSLNGYLIGADGTPWDFIQNTFTTIIKSFKNNHWEFQNCPTDSIYLNSIYFINKNFGWIVGDKGRILYTKNGGM